jgi:hypothetical protein
MGDVLDRRPSFWLLADNSVSLGSNRNRIGTFVASLKHALIFHERILLSDSLVVNTPNLRRAIQSDEQLREYLASGCLVIARRKAGERLVDLLELRDRFIENNSRNPGFEADPKAFVVDSDLKELQGLAPTVQYDPLATQGHYTNNIMALTSDAAFRRQLGSDADAVCRTIGDAILRHHHRSDARAVAPRAAPWCRGERTRGMRRTMPPRIAS